MGIKGPRARPVARKIVNAQYARSASAKYMRTRFISMTLLSIRVLATGIVTEKCFMYIKKDPEIRGRLLLQIFIFQALVEIFVVFVPVFGVRAGEDLIVEVQIETKHDEQEQKETHGASFNFSVLGELYNKDKKKTSEEVYM